MNPPGVRVGRWLRFPLTLADMMLGALVLCFIAAWVAVRAATARRRCPSPRRLLVLDTAWSLPTIRSRGLQHTVLCRDLGGYFDHVLTVQPLAGASGEDSPEFRLGPRTSIRLADRHTFLHAPAGRYYALGPLPRLNFALAQAGLLRDLAKRTRSEGIGFVRAGDASYQGVLGLALARVSGVPLVVRIAGNPDELSRISGRALYPRLFPRRNWERRVEAMVLHRADLVAGANENNLAYAVAVGARPERTTLFRYGNLVHPAHFTDPASRGSADVMETLGLSGREVLVYIGRLEPAKNAEDLIPMLAAVRLARPRVALLVVGDGSLRSSMEQDIALSGLGAHVVFAGNRAQEWIAQVLPGATVAVSPHMGRALVEVALAGLPLVAYDRDWQRELVQEGVTGRLISNRDHQAMATAVTVLLEDRVVSVAMGANARRSALRQHDPHRLAEHERRSYEDLAERWTTMRYATAGAVTRGDA